MKVPLTSEMRVHVWALQQKKLIVGLMLGLAVALSPISVSCMTIDESVETPLQVVANSVANRTGGFTEEGSYVIRCTKVEKDERVIAVTASKSKQAHIVALLLVGQRAVAATTVAYVPISGEESGYDLTEAEFYAVSSASLDTLVPAYGIAFSDWQAGLVSGSEKFPCCE